MPDVKPIYVGHARNTVVIVLDRRGAQTLADVVRPMQLEFARQLQGEVDSVDDAFAHAEVIYPRRRG